MMKIAVVGLGYVGLSLATLFSQKYEVVALDILPEKIKKINSRISPLNDEYIEKYFKEKQLNLKATLDYKEAFKDARFVIICTPTNYDDENGYFNTSHVEKIVKDCVEVCDLEYTTIVIKSTVPIGFTEAIKSKYNIKNIMFSPEFLREGNALYDNLYPSRIIIGDKNEKAREFASLLKEASLRKDVMIKYMNSTEAEAVKLFANAYLALRVSFFNELDTYAELKNLNAEAIIDGVCLDPRIGCYYNNPSFGYGGYCLSKDTKQLYANYEDVPQNIIEAIIKSNDTRKNHITEVIIKKGIKCVGAYRLAMKSGSDNFRSSAIQDIIEKLRKEGLNVIIYEPSIKEDFYNGFEVEHTFDNFTKRVDIILANRIDSQLDKVKEKVYTRDIFNKN